MESSSSSPRKIPGFYYDENKKKYFKVQPNHAAIPSAANYTRQAVKEKQETSKRRKLNVQENHRRRHQTIERSPLRDPRLAGCVLAARLGGIETSRKAGLVNGLDMMYTRNLTNKTIYPPKIDFDNLGPQGLPWSHIGSFVHDKETGGVISVVHSDRRLVWIRELVLADHFGSRYTARAQGKSSCLSISNSRVLMLSTNESAPYNAAYIQLIPLMDPLDALNTWGVPVEYGDGTDVFHFNKDRYIWSTAASPQHSRFAVASSQNLDTFESTEGRWHTQAYLSAETEFMTAEWQTANVIMAGQRNGRVIVIDTRAQGYAFRLRHQSGVTGTKKIDDSRVIVRGLDEMLMYDLRFAKRPNKKRPKEYTRPYMKFPEFQGSDRFCLGMDYYPEMKILATASDKRSPFATNPAGLLNQDQGASSHTATNNNITTFSTLTGRPIPSSPLHARNYPEPITQISFVPSISLNPPYPIDPARQGADRRGQPMDLLHTGRRGIDAWSAVGWADTDHEDIGGKSSG